MLSDVSTETRGQVGGLVSTSLGSPHCQRCPRLKYDLKLQADGPGNGTGKSELFKGLIVKIQLWQPTTNKT